MYIVVQACQHPVHNGQVRTGAKCSRGGLHQTYGFPGFIFMSIGGHLSGIVRFVQGFSGVSNRL
jgi:hypothetical protein